ncbi:ATP-binding protein [Kitasatospora purpeofusca]|uniref:HD domain-containing protein n=1 Tax=Kitasatospora purpeofusca TaxID=67352 RepID=UPI003253E18A
MLASKACDLPAFGGLSLTQTRKDLQELLGRIGSYGFFDEYTKHDISHIDAMLGKLDWLVTPQTREAMTPADWLLVVLAVYFHDLGMLVTKSEFERREESDFPQFCAEIRSASDSDSRDYLARLDILGEEERERFLYQEFVRHHHAARVRKWITGDSSPNLGATDKVVEEIQDLLRPVEPVFRADLAKVCESHHLDDLYDVKRYPVERYYGSTANERANVQFAAILLRSADLLHVTSDRTPSVAFRVLNPVDPISQNEWAKQRAVRAVVPKRGLDKDGVPCDDAPQDTIAVHATFTDENGYFGLTSYLRYAEEQLRLSHTWAQRSNATGGSKYVFPWRAIDTSCVEAEGFLTEPFQFTIDQQKVLDLLTGHTLYNDTNVVLRELLQNSIDAVRLQHGTRALDKGRVEVRWDSKQRVLEICDNGTGMTQDVIENNLLRAGSSLYQDPEFRKRNPDFNPISRFGIGVLSTFMVADQVEIITCHPDEEKARQLSLRSVHGQYLVRTLDKGHEVPEQIRPHGTIVRLTLRPSAELKSVTRTARHFVVLPECEVTVREDDGEVQGIGFTSIGEALRDLLAQSRRNGARDLESGKIRIVESSRGNMSIAFAVRWNSYFSEWTFLSPEPGPGPSATRQPDAIPATGVCVAGVRVETGTPGFRGVGPILAIANTSGTDSPRTNVARTSLEPTPERDAFVRWCYTAYSDHVVYEIQQLRTEREYSITWAAQEAAIIAHPLIGPQSNPISIADLDDAVCRIPFFLIEEGGERRCVTAGELHEFEEIETTESAVTEHVEHLLRELPGGTRESVVALLGTRAEGVQVRRSPVLCNRIGRDEVVDGLFLAKWEIGRVTSDIANRACTVGWVEKGEEPRWTPQYLPSTRLAVLDREIERYGATPLVRLPIGDLEVVGFPPGMRGFIVGDASYLLPGHPWQAMVDELTAWPGDDAKERMGLLCWLISQRVLSEDIHFRRTRQRSSSVAELEELIQRVGLSELVDWDEFAATCRSPESVVDLFDTRKWRRWRGSY